MGIIFSSEFQKQINEISAKINVKKGTVLEEALKQFVNNQNEYSYQDILQNKLLLDPKFLKTVERSLLSKMNAVDVHGKSSFVHPDFYEAEDKPEESIDGVLGSATADTSKIQQLEDQIRISEKRFKKAQEIAHVGYWEIDLINFKFWASEEALRIYGINDVPDVMPFDIFQKCVLPQYRSVMDQALRKLIYNEDVYDEEFQIRRYNSDEILYLHSKAELIHAEDGTMLKAVGILQDITRYKKKEATLRESEVKFKSIYYQSPTGKGLYDFEGRFVDINPACMEIFGIEKNEEMKGFRLFDDPNIPDDAKEKIKSGDSVRFEIFYNFDLIKEMSLYNTKKTGGSYLDFLITLWFFENDYPSGYLVNITDITKNKKAEAERLKSQNLESLGVFAGGIAHDFNNLLTSVMGSASLINMTTKNEKDKKCAERIIESSQKAALLTNQLLTFSKGGGPIKTKITIREAINHSLELSPEKSNVDIDLQFGESSILEADPNQLSNAIRNIINNAKEAITDKGKITITTSDIIENEKPFIKILIKDSGKGIPKEIIDKIFDPYFSTKSKGNIKGSGLGLSVTYSIIKKHGGRIWAHSEEGEGTTFEILLPAIRNEIKRIAEENKMHERKYINGEINILLLDDGEFVKNVLRDLLTYMGHNVIRLKEGNEALEFYNQAVGRNETYDCVILDVDLKKERGGRETLKKLREIKQDSKIVVISDYSKGNLMDYRNDGFDAILGKPYNLKELNEVIKKVINKPALRKTG